MPKYIIGSVILGIVFSWVGVSFTTAKGNSKAEWNTRIYQIISLANCIYATGMVIWLTNRFKKPGMSGGVKREIRSRYVEYVVLYAVFNWPICALTKPSYRYMPSIGMYLGGT